MKTHEPLLELERILIEKPTAYEDMSGLMKKYLDSPEEVINFIRSVSEDKYLYWDEIKYKTPPEGFNIEEIWHLVKFFRKVQSNYTPIMTPQGNNFKLYRQEKMLRYQRLIDMHSGGSYFIDSKKTTQEWQKYLIVGLIEEAIASSQLEGASTTRKAALAMIAENRPPSTKSEKMIYNNYETMKFIEEEYRNKPMSVELLCDLQRKLTADTLNEEESGRFRTDKDEVRVVYNNKISHLPPPMEFVNSEIPRFISYANEEDDDNIHPSLKAILLHFWIGYLHPFCDGNGRVARAVFYWYMLKRGYWLIKCFPLSRIIKKSSKQYAYAYIYSEQDDNDVTYFVDYNFKKIELAITEFKKYTERKIAENKKIESIVAIKKIAEKINFRQKQILDYITENKNHYVTVTSHSTLNGISRVTAAKDLKELERLGLVEAKRAGKYIHYVGIEG